MLSGTEHGISKPNIVIQAGHDLDLSLRVKRERMMAGAGKGYNIIGCVETIVFERDKGADMDDEDLLRQGKIKGRCLYWPDNCPAIARTIPEEDLIFANPLRLPLPDISDVDAKNANPYKVNRGGKSLLAPGEAPNEPRKIKQKLEHIASGKFRNFLVFQPVAQITLLMGVSGHMIFGTIGDHRMPLSALSGFDGRKMALLIDPYTGEAYFSGGRYSISLKG